MIDDHLLVQTLTWIEPGTTTDRYNNTVDDWSTATRTEIAAYVEQQNRTELRDGRDTLVSGWLLMTNELAVTSRARFEWDGHTFEVDGEPSKPTTPDGPHHLEARLLLVTG